MTEQQFIADIKLRIRFMPRVMVVIVGLILLTSMLGIAPKACLVFAAQFGLLWFGITMLIWRWRMANLQFVQTMVMIILYLSFLRPMRISYGTGLAIEMQMILVSFFGMLGLIFVFRPAIIKFTKLEASAV